MFCCVTFPSSWSTSNFLTACVDQYAMLLHFPTFYSNPDMIFRWITTMFKYGVKFHMMAGPFAISPFSPCEGVGVEGVLSAFAAFYTKMLDLASILVVTSMRREPERKGTQITDVEHQA
jgi:hypothetical protein